MMTARKEARQVVRDESKARLRGEQVALKEAAIQRVRAGVVIRLAAARAAVQARGKRKTGSGIR
jgi:hypothetical protein